MVYDLLGIRAARSFSIWAAWEICTTVFKRLTRPSFVLARCHAAVFFTFINENARDSLSARTVLHKSPTELCLGSSEFVRSCSQSFGDSRFLRAPFSTRVWRGRHYCGNDGGWSKELIRVRVCTCNLLNGNEFCFCLNSPCDNFRRPNRQNLDAVLVIQSQTHTKRSLRNEQR